MMSFHCIDVEWKRFPKFPSNIHQTNVNTMVKMLDEMLDTFGVSLRVCVMLLHYRSNILGVIVCYIFCFNPLSAIVGYIRHDTVVTSDSCNSGHSQNYEKLLTFSCKSLKFSTKWYTKLCILVDPFLSNCVTKSNFRYLKKKSPKKGSGT